MPEVRSLYEKLQRGLWGAPRPKRPTRGVPGKSFSGVLDKKLGSLGKVAGQMLKGKK